MNIQVDLFKVDEESLSPEAYLNLSKEDRTNIASTRILPSQLGKADFGRIQVIYKNPTYNLHFAA